MGYRSLITKPVYRGDYSDLTCVASTEEAMAEADMLIQRLLEHKRSLQVYRNSYSPVSRLPAELLLSIFHLCTPESSELFGDDTPAIQLFAFSHVCQWWRRLALNDASLWTTPVCKHPRLALHFMRRGQGLPTHFYVDQFRSLTSALFLQALLAENQVLQLATLEIRASPEQMKSLLANLPDIGLYCNKLALYTNGLAVLPYNYQWKLGPSASVTLHRCRPLLWSTLFRNLRSLYLFTEPADGLIQSTVTEILEVLRHNTLLRRIRLINAFKLPSLAMSEYEGSISMPELKELSIDDSLDVVVSFLSRLELPKLHSLSLNDTRMIANSPKSYSTIIQELSYQLRRLLGSQIPIRAMKCDEAQGLLSIGCLWTPSLSSIDTQPDLVFHLDLEGDYDRYYNPDTPYLFATLFRTLPLEKLEHLAMNYTSSVTDSTGLVDCWRSVASLSSLVSLKVDGDRQNITDLFRSLMIDSANDEVTLEANPQKPFPMLRSLHICGQDMSLGYADTERYSLAQQLSFFLRSAAVRGCPLEDVLLSDCTFVESLLDELDPGRECCDIRIENPKIIISPIAWWEGVTDE